MVPANERCGGCPELAVMCMEKVCLRTDLDDGSRDVGERSR